MSNNNSDRLKQIMDEHDLKPDDVASMLNRSVWTVYQWRSGYAMPAALLELLEFKLAAMQGGNAR